jgi:hypothetical protein
MLLAVGLALGRIWARRVEAAIQRRRVGVLVIDMAVTLLLRRPAMFMVLALVVGALPWTLMSLEVLGEVTRPLELLIAQRALMNLRFGVLLTPGHRPEDVIFVVVVEGVRHRTLHRGGGQLLRREDLIGGDTYSLPILLTH